MRTQSRSAFEHYFRTGRRPAGSATFACTQPVEQKFNPYHDPRDGRFTFAPGGPDAGRFLNPVARQARAPTRPPSRSGRGGNGGPPMDDPLTLEQMVPRLAHSPAGSIIAVADSVFDLTGPSRAATDALTKIHMKAMIRQIQEVDPNYRFQSLGFPASLEGQNKLLRDLRLDRAAAFYRVRGEVRPLQVETLKFLQGRADTAYTEGERLLAFGRIRVRLSSAEALGNHIDRSTRRDLRALYEQRGISTNGESSVRIIGREYDTSGSDRTYRIPDARVGRIAFDVSLTRKSLSTAQVRGFFNSDFRPDAVIIVRPSQLGPNSTYVIVRPAK
jgi:hypothetical protein